MKKEIKQALINLIKAITPALTSFLGAILAIWLGSCNSTGFNDNFNNNSVDVLNAQVIETVKE